MIHYLEGNAIKSIKESDVNLVEFGHNLFVIECEICGGSFIDESEAVKLCKLGMKCIIKRVVVLSTIPFSGSKVEVAFEKENDNHDNPVKNVPLDALFNEEGLPNKPSELPIVESYSYLKTWLD